MTFAITLYGCNRGQAWAGGRLTVASSACPLAHPLTEHPYPLPSGGAYFTPCARLGLVPFLHITLNTKPAISPEVARGAASPLLATSMKGEPMAARILVAEDNAINQLVIVHMLESLGYGVHAVEDGRQAVDAVSQRSYDLVLMDVHMPEMDGFATTVAIRQEEAAAGQGRHLPIVAVTADNLHDVETCRAAGMDDYLSKPITRERLAAVVERWVAPYEGGGRACGPSGQQSGRQRS
jgi:CheY-like chemotaxis protein